MAWIIGTPIASNDVWCASAGGRSNDVKLSTGKLTVLTMTAGGSRSRSAAGDDRQSVRDGDIHGRGEAVGAVADDGKPASGVEQVVRVFADVRELQSFDGRIIGGVERAFVLEGERGGLICGESAGKVDADGGFGGDALDGVRRQRLASGIEHTCDAQRIVQFEGERREFVEGSDMHAHLRREPVRGWGEVSVNDVLVSDEPLALSKSGQCATREQGNGDSAKHAPGVWHGGVLPRKAACSQMWIVAEKMRFSHAMRERVPRLTRGR